MAIPGVSSFFPMMEAQRGIAQALPMQGGQMNPLYLAAYFRANPAAHAQFNQMLSPYGLSIPDQLPQHPIFHQLDNPDAHGFVSRHAGLFGGLERAMLGAAATPAGAPVEGAGQGISRALQGAMGVEPAIQNYAARTFMTPLTAASQAAQLQLGQSIVNAEQTGAGTAVDTAQAKLLQAQADQVRAAAAAEGRRPYRVGAYDYNFDPTANGGKGGMVPTVDYSSITPLRTSAGRMVYTIPTGHQMVPGPNGPEPYVAQPGETLLPAKNVNDDTLALMSALGMTGGSAAFGKVIQGRKDVRGTPTTHNTAGGPNSATPDQKAQIDAAKTAYNQTLTAWKASQQNQINLALNPAQYQADFAAFSTKQRAALAAQIKAITGGSATGSPSQPKPPSASHGGGIPATARAQLREGAQTTFANGQTWTLKKGKPVRIK